MLVYGQDQDVIAWVADKLGWRHEDFDRSTAIGIVRNDRPVAGVIYSEYRGDQINMTIASTSPLWASRQTLFSLFFYPFNELGCIRINALTAKRNKKARKFLERLGFKLEGVLRIAHKGQDACVYGLLKSECKWLEL